MISDEQVLSIAAAIAATLLVVVAIRASGIDGKFTLATRPTWTMNGWILYLSSTLLLIGTYLHPAGQLELSDWTRSQFQLTAAQNRILWYVLATSMIALGALGLALHRRLNH